jgi:hypothetical protein
MIFSAGAYRAATLDYQQTWKTLDATLRNLCVAHPTHKESAAVHAKVWIIGRTFATGIERTVSSDRSQGSSASKVARHFLKHHKEIDRIFSQVSELREPLTHAHLRLIIQAHARFLKLINTITTRSPRSFASKYMHFHAPLVPIYDAVANQSLTKRVRWLRSYYDFEVPPEHDDEYAWYATRFFHLFEKALAEADGVTVRLLEFSLLCGDGVSARGLRAD